MITAILWLHRTKVGLLSLAGLLWLAGPQARAQVAFTKGEGEMGIAIDGKPFATYVWGDVKTHRPYFKQVKALGGEVQLTRNHPPQPGDLDDHATYHPGIWWGFGDVGGNDYWRLKAKVIGGDFVGEPKGGRDRGSFAVRNRMLVNGGEETFCEQVCRYTIFKRHSGILMVCESTFVQGESDFWLGDQEEMGLAIRVATPIAMESNRGGRIVDSAGRTVLKEIRTHQSDWCDYSGPISGKHGGILVMNDPGNFRKPWWHAVDTGLLIANPLGESELSGRGKKRENVLVKKGKPFRLRYGALIHLSERPGEFDPKKAYDDFLEVLSNKLASARTDLPEVPQGFKVSIFAREPMVYKPTSICFDARGRLMVGQGPQYPKNLEATPTDSVVILVDSDGDGVADSSKTFATGFNSIQGLAWKGGDLYVANAPELTVVRDLGGDDEADEYVMVYTDLGNREHALHGLTWGPDGKLYMSKGNSKGHNQPEKYGYVAPKPFRELWDVVHPPGAPDTYPPKTFTKDTYKKTYHHWDDDWGREGGVLRCDPLGENLEIVSRGMRNPWDMAIDDGFNFLGTDNDQDQGDRIIMPFFGGHFGWGHTYSSHWTGESHLPTAPISGPVFPGSGTGVIYYAHAHFPAEYRNVFFISDWMNGTYVYRPTWDGSLMQPQGGSWERFAQRGDGEMLYRPTDMEFAPDGSIYICGWGGDYHYDRREEGSWLFRITHENAKLVSSGDDRPPSSGQWSVDRLLADLGPETLPVWRVKAQDELVRRSLGVRDRLMAAIESGKLSRGQQTWALWALARGNPADSKTKAYLSDLIHPDQRRSLNLRIQAIRILAHQIRDRMSDPPLPAVVIGCLTDSEPRIRFEVVQAIWQAREKRHIEALVDQMAVEDDRLTFYCGWRALRELAARSYRRGLLADERPSVRLAALLSLLEGHEMALDEVLETAARDSDRRVQSYALTWAMNPRPPEKMPNTTARIELEESFSIQDLIQRVGETESPKLRQAYLTVISRATYRGGDDWERLREFYEDLVDGGERALVLVPLARENAALPMLWEALSGSDGLRRAAVKGFASLAQRPGNSSEQMAGFLLGKAASDAGSSAIAGVVETLYRLGLGSGWRAPKGWDLVLARALQTAEEVPLQSKILAILQAIDPDEMAGSETIRAALGKTSEAPDPRLYTMLVRLNERAGVDVALRPPDKATVEGVLAKLPQASADRGRELFFSANSSTACLACHRIAGKGTHLAPDLSGISRRSETKTIIESIIDPSATITEGFQLQTFDGAEGATVGVVLRETDSEIRILKPDGTQETLLAGSLTKRAKLDQSVMPDIYDLLGDEQVADMVAFLSRLR